MAQENKLPKFLSFVTENT